MKIGIDISQIVHGTGVSFYTASLVENLARIDNENEYVLIGSSLRLRNVLNEFVVQIKKINNNFSSKIIPLPPILAEPLWNKFRFSSIEKFIGQIDVFHSSDWTQPSTKAAKVTTIHDFGFLKYPAVGHPKIVATMKRRLELVKKECDLIIAVSKATKKDTIDLLGIPSQKIRVVYEAAPDEFKKTTAKEIKKVKNKFKIKGDFLLSVSTLEPRKNLQRIISAFRVLKKKNKSLSLVMVGKVGWGESLSIEDGEILTGYISDHELSALYSGASCFLYPSLYEGFGQPILEAMNCGCPVVTANISSMPEVAGEAAVLVDPLSVKSIAEGIKKALKNREKLIEKGFKQVKKFSWEKCARETLAVYEEAAGL